MENQVLFEKVKELATIDLITWFFLHWIYYILSNFAMLVRKQNAAEEYLI